MVSGREMLITEDPDGNIVLVVYGREKRYILKISTDSLVFSGVEYDEPRYRIPFGSKRRRLKQDSRNFEYYAEKLDTI